MLWRRDRDSNPGTPQRVNGFRDRPVRPLRHLSASVVLDVALFNVATSCLQLIFSPTLYVAGTTKHGAHSLSLTGTGLTGMSCRWFRGLGS